MGGTGTLTLIVVVVVVEIVVVDIVDDVPGQRGSHNPTSHEGPEVEACLRGVTLYCRQ